MISDHLSRFYRRLVSQGKPKEIFNLKCLIYVRKASKMDKSGYIDISIRVLT